MCKQHALRIAWTIPRSIAFLDFRVLRWKFTYDWKCVNTTYPVPLFMPTACFPEGPSPPFTFCSFWRRQRLEAVLTLLNDFHITSPKCSSQRGGVQNQWLSYEDSRLLFKVMGFILDFRVLQISSTVCYIFIKQHSNVPFRVFTLVNVNAPVVATTSWWLHFTAPVVA